MEPGPDDLCIAVALVGALVEPYDVAAFIWAAWRCRSVRACSRMLQTRLITYREGCLQARSFAALYRQPTVDKERIGASFMGRLAELDTHGQRVGHFQTKHP